MTEILTGPYIPGVHDTELTVQMTNEELAQAIDAAVAHYKMLNFEAQVNTRNHIAALQKVQLQRAMCVVQKDTK